MAAALILAAVRQLSFDRMMQHIQRLRAIEPHKMLRGELAEWVYVANVGQLPEPQVKVPVPFVTSLMDGALMHAVCLMIGTLTHQPQHVDGARVELVAVVFIQEILNMLMMFLRPLHMVARFARVAGACFPQVYSRSSGITQRLGEGNCQQCTALLFCMPGL